jgi:peptidoglycan/xylan/chitin deacetylase (PgdA/CDA1 family)
MTGEALRYGRIINGRLRNLRFGLFNLIGNPVVILLYHRVTVLSRDSHSIAVSPVNFRAQMEYLNRNYRIVRFEDNWSTLSGPAIVVTFDDGYADNALEALPILDEVGVPATFFISTGDMGSTNAFWWDELERLLLGEFVYPSCFVLKDPRHGKTWLTTDSCEREIMHRELHSLILTINAERRKGWLTQIREWAGQESPTGETDRILNLDELKNLASNQLVTIGAHTVSHTPLSAMTEEEQRHEIIQSRDELEKFLGRKISVFSYPFGKKSDYNETSTRICLEAGFTKVAAAFPGQVYRWTDHYQIPRHTIYNWDLETFATRLKCLWI